ncbi:MAG: feoB [Crocinitomicaceae bacterium]|jgi:ferrous iron transport protein B|nr:feoB [Crocinitomicaceae bacterium]
MKKVALLGNPNTGKTSVFNRLTGLNQHVGNFPGVTVDKKSGTLHHDGQTAEIIDFPGTYSIYPHSNDEQVVYDVFSNPRHPDFPDLTVVVLDAGNLERNLLLFTQVYDLQIPVIAVLNMSDVAGRKGIKTDLDQLKQAFPGVRICETNARAGFGMKELKELIFETPAQAEFRPLIADYNVTDSDNESWQESETRQRYTYIKEIITASVRHENPTQAATKASVWDKLTVHPVWGYVIFALILLLIFQLIFSIASLPMDLIDGAFADFANWTGSVMPEGVLTDLLTGGIIPGLGGVLVFLPQILLLFFCLGILEETGYLARAVFIMDRLMRPFGLNGKSVVPLISSAACAIPGVMATRTIPNWKERLITILVAPLMSCSARIPVFTLLIALVIPNKYLFGFLSLQGLTLFAMYMLGLFSALAVAWVMTRFIKTREKSYFLLEIPEFKAPRWGNIFLSLYEKSKIFVWEAGKVILAISILLWALASYGPGERIQNAVRKIDKTAYPGEKYEDKVASVKLENSYMGILGKTIEPVIRPLGFDWKIGISLLTSFAAREVFVGSMATIYSVHQEDNEGLLETMRQEKHPDGTPVYSLATGLSLMVFYVYAMQCMATLAIVKRETKSWKWPIVQLVYMGILAYLSAMITYQIFS